MKMQDMTQRYRKFKRAWGMWYAFNKATGNSVSLKTRLKAEALQKVNAMNETERQPSINSGLMIRLVADSVVINRQLNDFVLLRQVHGYVARSDVLLHVLKASWSLACTTPARSS
jgi:hypothetical protein